MSSKIFYQLIKFKKSFLITENLLNFKRFQTTNKVSVNLSQGLIYGRQEKLPNGEYFYSFKGIPYAVPPLKNLRFEDPKPLGKFNTRELDCGSERDISLHRDPFEKNYIGSEDCLYLNVYTPKLNSEKSLSVMIWVHGGYFQIGSGNSQMFNPLYLMQEDVIVVTLNYRLGMFGFLSFPEVGVSGNAGLKDQLLAFKWVNENIHQFNGDTTNITVFGQSAGAASIHFHLFTQTSKKYFHKAILQSGTANMQWVIQKNSEYKVKRLAEFLGFKGNDDKYTLINFLKNQKSIDLLKYQFDLLTPDELRRDFPITFQPVVEAKNENAIVIQPPLESLKIRDLINIPIMMGSTSNEGLMFFVNIEKKLDLFDKDLSRFIPRSVNISLDDKNCRKIADQIRKFYFNDCKIDKKSLDQLLDLMTDYHFNIGIHTATELHARNQHNSPLYFYRFAYDGGRNMYKKLFNLQKYKGACHGDELFYLFQQANESLKNDSQDVKIIKRMCKMWANFAKYSNPTPKNNDDKLEFDWRPIKNISKNDEFVLDYLEIDENPRMEQNPDKERIDFWRQIYQDYNKGFLNQ